MRIVKILQSIILTPKEQEFCTISPENFKTLLKTILYSPYLRVSMQNDKNYKAVYYNRV